MKKLFSLISLMCICLFVFSIPITENAPPGKNTINYSPQIDDQSPVLLFDISFETNDFTLISISEVPFESYELSFIGEYPTEDFILNWSAEYVYTESTKNTKPYTFRCFRLARDGLTQARIV